MVSSSVGIRNSEDPIGSITWRGRVKNSLYVPPSQLLIVQACLCLTLDLSCVGHGMNPKCVRTLMIPYQSVVKECKASQVWRQEKTTHRTFCHLGSKWAEVLSPCNRAQAAIPLW